MKSEYFSYDPLENMFHRHETLEEAKQSAESFIDFYRDEAVSEGWNEEVSSVCYGEIKGFASLDITHDRNDSTQEEWDDMGYSDEFETIGDYSLKEFEE